MKYILDLQLFASKKGVGSTKNGRDSAGRRLGAKKSDGQVCTAGSILYRQRGTKVQAGLNVMRRQHYVFGDRGCLDRQPQHLVPDIR